MQVRVGQGFDVHAFSDDPARPLVLGGVVFDGERGLVGHSDADVLAHVAADALLGAAGLGDLGRHFPDTDPKWKGANSRKLLRHIVALMNERGYAIGNVDATIIAQAPKLAPHVAAMRQHLAADLECTIDDVSVKATTTERLGFAGRGEGIAVEAVVLLEHV